MASPWGNSATVVSAPLTASVWEPRLGARRALTCQSAIPGSQKAGSTFRQLATICWRETDYFAYTMRQVSRRSWRIGRASPCRASSRPTGTPCTADALNLVAKKLESPLAVEGELLEDGLAAYGYDLMLAPAPGRRGFTNHHAYSRGSAATLPCLGERSPGATVSANRGWPHQDSRPSTSRARSPRPAGSRPQGLRNVGLRPRS